MRSIFGILTKAGIPGNGCRLTEPYRHARFPHLSLAANVRLDNREELHHALGIPAGEAALPDGYYLLAAYDRWGSRYPEHVLGVITAAIWDDRTSELTLCTDPLGIQPLYFHDSPERFIFASGVRDILAVPGVPSAIDEEYYWAFCLRAHHYLKPRTAFPAIQPLLEGEVLIAGRDRLKRSRYWIPENVASVRITEKEAADGLRAHLERAVRHCLRTDRPVGAHVSGGLDSTSVAVLADQQLKARGRRLAGVYSWSPEPETPGELPEWDERWAVEQVCRQQGWTCQWAAPPVDEWLEVSLADPAFDLPVGPVNRYLARLARQDGVGVVLSGWGGDELASCGGGLMWDELFRSLRWRTLLSKSLDHCRATSRPLWRHFAATLLFPRLPGFVQRAIVPQRPDWRAVARRHLAPWNKAHLIDDPSPTRTVRERQRRNLNNGHLILRTRGWFALGAQHGFEYRYPLLDRRLIEFVLSMPPEVWMGQGQTRFLFRQAIAGLLPPALERRPKDEEWGARQALPPDYEARRDRMLADGGGHPHFQAFAVRAAIMKELRELNQSRQTEWVARFDSR